MFSKRFKKLSLKYKLLLTFVFISVLPILTVQTVTYYNSTESMKSKLSDLVNLNLEQTAGNIEATLNSYDDLLFQIIYFDEEIPSLVKQVNEGSYNDQIKNIVDLTRKISLYSNAKKSIRSISVFTTTNRIIIYDKKNFQSSTDTNFSIWKSYPDITKIKLYKDATESNDMVVEPSLFQDAENEKYYLIHIARKIFDYKSKQIVGVVVITIDESVLSDICNKGINGKGNSFSYLVNTKGDIVSFPDKEFIGTNINTYKAAAAQKGNSMKPYEEVIKMSSVFGNHPVILNSYNIANFGMILVNGINQSFFFKEMYWSQKLIIIIGVLAILFAMTIIFYVSNYIAKSIKKIVSAMKAAQKGELSVQIDFEDTGDEISIISSNFNRMIRNTNELVQEVKIQMHHVCEAAKKQKEAEIRTLEAQINPHFIYNTLDSINWMAIEKGEYEISKMLKFFSEILRYATNKCNKIVTLRDELEWLNRYIYLQKSRFDNCFECITDFDGSVLDFRIYKLLLQPFVENSIIHGFANCASGGVIKISGRLEDDNRIRLSIEDNGKGIDEKVLKELNDNSYEDLNCKANGLGVKNVFERIKSYYGDRGACHIYSEKGKGTLVSIIIPNIEDWGAVI